MALQAYPPPEAKKKEKKVKDRGSRFPGATAATKTAGSATAPVESKADGHVEGKVKDEVDLASDAGTAMKNLDIKATENGT